MKKIVALVAVLFSVVVPVQSQASVGEKIVIIDSYFDNTKTSGSIQFVCLASDKCVNKATLKPGLGTDPANHGTLMANIARQQNPTATLVLIQTEEVNKVDTFDTSKKDANGKVIKTLVKTEYVPTTLDGSDFIKALTWVDTNKSSVTAVSFSYNLTNSNAKIGECKISAQGGVVAVMDSSIKTLVKNLKENNIPVLAAAGNNKTKPLQYPACITDVVSIGSDADVAYVQTGVDIVGSISNTSNTNYSTTVSPWFGSVVFSTSAATVAVASNWKTNDPLATKVTVLSN